MGRLDFLLSMIKRSPLKRKILVLFDGDGSISKAAKLLGYDVRTLDILPLEHIDLVMDILTFAPAMLGGWVPDEVWASPPCETFSCITRMTGGGNLYYQSLYAKNGKTVIGTIPRTDFTIDKRLVGRNDSLTKKGSHHRAIVDKTVSIINHYLKVNPKLIWYIENPATGCIRYYLAGKIKKMVENKTTYCMYGAEYRKETSIFSNVKLDLKYCRRHKEGVVDDCGGHGDGFYRRYDHKKQEIGVVLKRNYLEKSVIPEKLCIDILTQAKQKVLV